MSCNGKHTGHEHEGSADLHLQQWRFSIAQYQNSLRCAFYRSLIICSYASVDFQYQFIVANPRSAFFSVYGLLLHEKESGLIF